MLKVVGASWYKTRVSTYILLGAALLAVSAFFIADMERPQLDDTYCATAFWSNKSGFRIEFWGQQNNLDSVPKGCARACFKDILDDNGCAQIEVETQPDYPDQIQAYGAGILEGALTWSYIYEHWLNTVDAFCDSNEENKLFCQWLRNILTSNYNYTMENFDKIKGSVNHDHYWYQIRLFYYQLEGIEFGFRRGVKRSRYDWEIDFEDFLLMNSASDLKDLKVYYDNYVMLKNDIMNSSDIKSHLNDNFNYENSKSIIFLKILHKNSTLNLLLGHSSAESFQSKMIRVLKRYNLNYHFSTDLKSHLVPGNEIILTGYPGSIASMDDFYVVSGEHSRLAIAGVKMKYKNNRKLWKHIDYLENSAFLSARLMTANRLAHSGRSWARIMSRHPNSGSKQWIVIDTKRFHMIDMNFTRIINTTNILPVVEDLDENLLNQTLNETVKDSNNKIINNTENVLKKIKYQKGTLWVIDQVPGRLHGEDLTEEIFKLGYWNGNGIPYFNETSTISGLSSKTIEENILQKLHKNISNLETMLSLLKKWASLNDFIAEENKSSAYGNIDVKLYSENISGKLLFQIVSGSLHHHPENFNRISSMSLGLESTSTSPPTHSPSTTSSTSVTIENNLEENLKNSIDVEINASTIAKRHSFHWASNSNYEDDSLRDLNKYSPNWAWINMKN